MTLNGLKVAILVALGALLVTLGALAWPLLPTFDIVPWMERIDLVGPATLVLALVTSLLVLSAREAAKHTRIIERAYVKMSHYSPPNSVALQFGQTEAVVIIQIHNSGHTPASVTGALLKLQILPKIEGLVPKPDYEGGTAFPKDSFAFLAAGADYQVRMPFNLPADKVMEAQSDEFRTYLYGYVDYIDVFGVRHRNGYASDYCSERNFGRLRPPL